LAEGAGLVEGHCSTRNKLQQISSGERSAGFGEAPEERYSPAAASGGFMAFGQGLVVEIHTGS